MYCTNCGYTIRENEKFCGQCGQGTEHLPKKPKRKVLIVTLSLLSLFGAVCVISLFHSTNSKSTPPASLKGNYYDPGFNMVPAEVSYKKEKKKDLLNDAIQDNNSKDVIKLISEGVDINLSEALVTAAKKKNYDMVELLLKHGANPNKTVREKTALNYAADNDDLKTAKLLLDSGADPDKGNPMDMTSPLWTSVQKGSKNMVKLLLECGADPNKIAVNNEYPIHIAKKLDYTDIYNLLIQYGAKENKRGR